MKKKTTPINGTLYAFWPYDQYPYCNGGTVVAMDEQGKVETKEFGPGNWFTPFKVMPVEQGKELRGKLKQLEVAHRDALLKVKAEANRLLDDVLEIPSRSVTRAAKAVLEASKLG